MSAKSDLEQDIEDFDYTIPVPPGVTEAMHYWQGLWRVAERNVGSTAELMRILTITRSIPWKIWLSSKCLKRRELLRKLGSHHGETIYKAIKAANGYD